MIASSQPLSTGRTEKSFFVPSFRLGRAEPTMRGEDRQTVAVRMAADDACQGDSPPAVVACLSLWQPPAIVTGRGRGGAHVQVCVRGRVRTWAGGRARAWARRASGRHVRAAASGPQAGAEARARS